MCQRCFHIEGGADNCRIRLRFWTTCWTLRDATLQCLDCINGYNWRIPAAPYVKIVCASFLVLSEPMTDKHSQCHSPVWVLGLTDLKNCYFIMSYILHSFRFPANTGTREGRECHCVERLECTFAVVWLLVLFVLNYSHLGTHTMRQKIDRAATAWNLKSNSCAWKVASKVSVSSTVIRVNFVLVIFAPPDDVLFRISTTSSHCWPKHYIQYFPCWASSVFQVESISDGII